MLPAAYTEGSLEFAHMLEVAETNAKAAYAAGNSYMYGSSRFCQDWYECFVLKMVSEEEYDKNVALVAKCLSLKDK
jgi:hypothetical protein